MTLAEFRAAFPEFANATDPLVQSRLDWALIRTPADIWDEHQAQGIGFLTAHYLALLPNAKDLRAGEEKGVTMYSRERDKLEGIVSSGFRVAGMAAWCR